MSGTRIEGAHAIVTGGSSGIGLATAELLARKGADVTLVARDVGRLEAAQEAIFAARASDSQRVEVRSADVADYEQVSTAIAAAEEALGPTSILVNCAGIFIPGEFSELPLKTFEDHMDIDVHGIIYACRAVVPGMVARGGGSIVNVSSGAGFLGIYGYTAYCAAKFAVFGFSEALRAEMAPAGVHVACVCPPDVDTPGLAHERSLRPPETERISGNVKPIDPSVVASAIVRGIETRRFLVIPDLTSRLVFALKGVWPGLVFAVIDSEVRKARRDTRA